MSRFFPTTPYAEDQPLARTILTTHVATRAVTMGSLIGAGLATGRHLLGSSESAARPPFAARLLRASGTSVAITVGVTGVMLVGRMYGREEVEWQDRSWRLLRNRGQLETDDWTYMGMLAGPATAAAVGRTRGLGWRGVVGAGGLGSVAGMLGYLTWRYGIKGGWKDEEQL
jgi:hypothetical protein